MDLKQELIELAKRDAQVRSDLVRRGELFDGYHPEMEQVHNANADRLEVLIQEWGWPTQERVGEEAAAAAWMIVQHAISKPVFQKNCLKLLKTEVENGSVKAALLAHLQDRVNVFEGQPQIYGTQFDWDSHGELSPKPIQDPEKVDTLRLAVGLPPLSEAVEQIRLRAKQEGNRPPVDVSAREAEFLKWAKKVGWRS